MKTPDCLPALVRQVRPLLPINAVQNTKWPEYDARQFSTSDNRAFPDGEESRCHLSPTPLGERGSTLASNDHEPLNELVSFHQALDLSIQASNYLYSHQHLPVPFPG